MSNPLPIELTQWQWVKVASRVSNGLLNRLSSEVSYYQTYRMYTDPPQDPPPPIVNKEIPSEAVKIFEKANQEGIQSLDDIDVYIMCCNTNKESSSKGKIRVDI